MAVVRPILAGLMLWAVGFNLLYAVHGLGCGLGWGDRVLLGPFTLLNAALVPLWLMCLALGAVALRRAMRLRAEGVEPALRAAGLVGGWAGLMGLVVTGAPVLLPAHCL
jgi:hypothetical protein